MKILLNPIKSNVSIFMSLDDHLIYQVVVSPASPVPDAYAPWASKPRSSTPGSESLGAGRPPGSGVLVETDTLGGMDSMALLAGKILPVLPWLEKS